MRLHHRLRCVAQQALGILSGASWEALLYQGVEGLLRALGRFLGGSWEALGKLLEASKRHLGPKTVMATIFKRILKKSEILGSHLGDVLTSQIVFFGAPRG